MTIEFYELAAENKEIKFSPFVWRTRMALLHKGVDFKSIAWQFRDRETKEHKTCLLYTSPSPRDKRQSRMPSSA